MSDKTNEEKLRILKERLATIQQKEEITPARISEKQTKEVQQISEQIYKKMNLRGICRIDFIIMNDIPYIIEINTIPGLSEESIIPKQAKEAGISLLQLFNNCIANTLNK